MVELTKKELLEINGNGIKAYIFIGGILTFIAGIFDGYTRPFRCRK